jgi:hypothetical protein
MSNWQSLLNQNATTLKKYISQILKEKYPPHDELFDRLAVALVTKGDVEAFSRLVVDIYETAYNQCVRDHSAALKQSGYEAVIKPGGCISGNHKIFQEKSG